MANLNYSRTILLLFFIFGILPTIITIQPLFGQKESDWEGMKVQLIVINGELTFDEKNVRFRFKNSDMEYSDDKKKELIHFLKKRFKDIYESIKKGNRNFKSGKTDEEFLKAYEYYNRWRSEGSIIDVDFKYFIKAYNVFENKTFTVSEPGSTSILFEYYTPFEKEGYLYFTDFYRLLKQLLIGKDTPLYVKKYKSTKDMDASIPGMPEKILLIFQVRDLINFDNVKIYLPENSGSEISNKTKHLILGDLIGELWSKERIERRLRRYLKPLGYDINVKFNCDSYPYRIEVKPAKIARITFESEIDSIGIDKCLYFLLQTRLFRKWVHKKDLEAVNVSKNNDKVHTLNLLKFPDREVPFLNGEDLQIQKLQLSQLGYTFFLSSTPTSIKSGRDDMYYRDIRVYKTSSLNETTGKETAGEKKKEKDTEKMEEIKMAPAISNSNGLIDKNEKITQPRGKFPTAEDKTSFKDVSNRKRDYRSFVGVGAEYESGQKLRLFASFQHRLKDNSSISVKIGHEDNISGSFNYHKDFLFFKGLKQKRLSLQINAHSEQNSNRILNGIETNESREGGKIRSELEWFRDLDGHLLKSYIEINRETVKLKLDNGFESRKKFTALEIGIFHFFDKPHPTSSDRLQIETFLRFGFPNDSESKFAKFKFKGNWHHAFSWTFDFDLTGHFELSSQNTPIFELPSLGPKIVRGASRDAAIGKLLYGIQAEIWTLLPIISRDIDKKFNRFIEGHFRLAFFVDIANISNTNGSEAGYRWSPGVGLRFLLNHLQISLDWAYGFGSKNSDVSRSRWSLNFKTNSPF
jgi:hypothetical protein